MAKFILCLAVISHVLVMVLCATESTPVDTAENSMVTDNPQNTVPNQEIVDPGRTSRETATPKPSTSEAAAVEPQERETTRVGGTGIGGSTSPPPLDRNQEHMTTVANRLAEEDGKPAVPQETEKPANTEAGGKQPETPAPSEERPNGSAALLPSILGAVGMVFLLVL